MDAALVDTVRNKYRARSLFARAGLPNPRFALIRSVADVAAAVAYVRFPAIIKPAYGAGSSWVFRVECETDVLRRLNQSWREMEADDYVQRSQMRTDRTFILESLIVGAGSGAEIADYCSVEGVVIDGAVRVLGVADRFRPAPPFRETGVVFPSSLEASTQGELAAAAERAVHTAGLRSGGFHAEFVCTSTGPVLIELNPRPGGPIPRLWSRLTGRSFVAEYALALLGEERAFDAPLDGAGGEHLFYASSDRDAALIAMAGLPDAAQLDGVDDVEVWRRPGEPLLPHQGCDSAVARIWTYAGSPEALVALDRKLRDTIDVEFQELT